MSKYQPLSDAIAKAREHAEKQWGSLPNHSFKWNKLLTRTMGKVRWGGKRGRYPQPLLSLSQPIILHLFENDQEEAINQTYRTYLHELAHIKAGKGQGHNHLWRKAMEELGLEPNKERYHNAPTGLSLISPSIRKNYPIGQRISFSIRGRRHKGVIIAHNPKRVKVTITSSSDPRYVGGSAKIRWARLSQVAEKL